MPRNGSGTYSLPSNSWNPASTGTTIESAASNATNTDIANALTQSISRDGQTPWQGIDDHGGNKISNIGNGTTSTDAMAYGQGAKLAGGNTFTGDQIINGAVSLSGDLTVTGAVIFTSGAIGVANLTVTSVASVASLNVTGTSNLNILNVASVASLHVLNVSSVASVNMLTVASTAAIAVLSVGSSIVVGAASGGSKGAGTINAQNIYINGTAVATTGKLVNRYYDEYATNTNLAVDYVLDDNVPTTSQGTQILSASAVTTTATQRLRLRAEGFGGSGALGGTLVIAAYAGSTCLQVCVTRFYDANRPSPVVLEYEFLVGSATTTSITIRAGGTSSGTARLNGLGSGRLFGGAAKTTLVVDVIEP